MDTFSISLSLGTFDISKRKVYIYSIFVGLLHFIMPLIGNYFGIKIVTYLNININLLLGIILLLISIEMFIDLIKKEDKLIDLNYFKLFLLGITVSLDSFSLGLGISAITNNLLMASTIFSLLAALFTFLGIIIGKYTSNKIGNYAKTFGIMLLFIISIIHIFE